MALVHQLRAATGAPAGSFQLMGEDLVALSGAAMAAAADEYRAALGELPAGIRERFEASQSEVLAESHRWLRKYNRSVHHRIAGYLALGRRIDFVYPWPVVAVLGICHVMDGFTRGHVYGLVGAAARRLRYRLLERIAATTDDVLRRTNRGIFADSIPTVLYALHCRRLADEGDAELASALMAGPLPPLMDEESAGIARSLFDGLAIADERARFETLAALTLRHFGREQKIFSHHMGASLTEPPPPARGLARRLTALESVSAPAVLRGKRGPRLVFRDYRLPAGFDIRDHGARVRELGRAYVASVTGTLRDYEVARDYVLARFAD